MPLYRLSFDEVIRRAGLAEFEADSQEEAEEIAQRFEEAWKAGDQKKCPQIPFGSITFDRAERPEIEVDYVEDASQ